MLRRSPSVLGQEPKRYKLVGVSLEPNAGAWRIPTGAGDINVGAITTDATNVTVNHSIGAANVNALLFTPGIEFAKLGWTFGASVGLTSSLMKGGRDVRVGGYVYYNGSQWVIDADSKGITSVSFSLGTLTINHASMPGLALTAISADTSLIATLGTAGTTSFQVKFYDFAGTLQTSASSSMKVYVTRPHSYVAIAPNTITLAGGIVQGLGIFEL